MNKWPVLQSIETLQRIVSNDIYTQGMLFVITSPETKQEVWFPTLHFHRSLTPLCPSDTAWYHWEECRASWKSVAFIWSHTNWIIPPCSATMLPLQIQETEMSASFVKIRSVRPPHDVTVKKRRQRWHYIIRMTASSITSRWTAFTEDPNFLFRLKWSSSRLNHRCTVK